MLNWFRRRRKIWPDAIAPAESGPDFLCIGMAKTGTSWLFDQLRYHPDFWLPSIKEFRYLHNPAPKMDNTLLRLSRYEDPKRRRTAGKADVAFTREAAALADLPMDMEKYAALFRYRGERMSGDISPGYERLSEREIARIAMRFPQLKILLLVRDPVARAWAHISMAYRDGNLNPSVLENAERFRAWFPKSAIKRQSFASNVYARWQASAPALPFRYVLFDDIKERPAETRRAVLEFLGADPEAKSGKLSPGFNRKENQARLALTEPFRAVLVEQLADEVRTCAAVFGGAARDWPARNGLA